MDYSKYVNKMPHPVPVEFICNGCGYIYFNRKIALDATFCKDCGALVKEHFEFLITEHMIGEVLYNKEREILYELFKNDALKESGLNNHPNKDKIFKYAWDKGDYYEYNSVASELSDLAELFK